MKITLYLQSLGWLALGLTLRAYSYENYCIEKRWEASRNSLYCQGVVIPSYKTRNFISEELRCGSGKHSKTREPVPFDEEKWRDLHNVDPGAAKDMLRSLPTPKWEGAVKYDSYLHWAWEDCRLVTSRSCGTKTVCSKKKNDKGEEWKEGEEECREEPKSCYMDVVVSESRHCSEEEMTYDLRYLQVDENDEHYTGRLVNGFDLLPGEHEGVTVSNGVDLFRATTLLPRVSFQEARNDYRVARLDGGSYNDSNLICRQNSNYHVGFTVLPMKRVQSCSGNAFSLPESFDGKKLDPLVWKRAKDSRGQWQEKGYPALLRLQDYSASALNEFTRDVGDIFKNMVVRIQLYDKSGSLWPGARNTMYVDEGKAVAQTLNALSDNQKVRRSYLWELVLATNSIDPRKNLYRNHIPWMIYYPARLLFPAESLSYENQLSPGTDYKLKLTVYQRGLSIYHQACEDDPEAWDCQFYTGGGWLSPKRYENNYFSDKSVDIDFTTPGNVNQRSYWPMFWNTVSAASNASLLGVVAYGVLRLAART